MHAKEEEQLKFEIDFYEPLVDRDPGNVDCLKILAENYTRVGRYEDGLKADLQLARLCPGEPAIQYNLACSMSLTGQLNRAVEILSHAIAMGYDDFEHMRKDPDLSAIRDLPAFRSLMEPHYDA